MALKTAIKAFGKAIKDRGGIAQIAKNVGRSAVDSFGKGTSAFRRGGGASAFDVVEGQMRYNYRKDLGVKLLAGTPKTAAANVGKIGKLSGAIGKGIQKMGRPILAHARTPVGKTATRGMFVGGATAMLGLWTMKGGMNEARDIAHERYMQDFTYSRSMLQNSRVGLASGTNKMLNYGGTQGLATAMHKTRHGR